MKIYAPVKDFNGWRNNVRFVNGVGETNDQATIEWFTQNGYLVEKSLEKCDEVIEKSVEKCEPIAEYADVDFDSMNPNELREWMKEHGYGFKIKNIRSKDKLLEMIRG